MARGFDDWTRLFAQPGNFGGAFFQRFLPGQRDDRCHDDDFEEEAHVRGVRCGQAPKNRLATQARSLWGRGSEDEPGLALLGHWLPRPRFLCWCSGKINLETSHA